MTHPGNDLFVGRTVDSREGLAVYIAGPMTGLPRWNYDAFEEAAWRLRAFGADVTSPHEMDIAAGFDPDSPTAGKKFNLQAALDADIAVVEASDLVVLLPGWEDSPGAIAEVLTAEAAGIPCLELQTVLAAIA